MSGRCSAESRRGIEDIDVVGRQHHTVFVVQLLHCTDAPAIDIDLVIVRYKVWVRTCPKKK